MKEGKCTYGGFEHVDSNTLTSELDGTNEANEAPADDGDCEFLF